MTATCAVDLDTMLSQASCACFTDATEAHLHRPYTIASVEPSRSWWEPPVVILNSNDTSLCTASPALGHGKTFTECSASTPHGSCLACVRSEPSCRAHLFRVTRQRFSCRSQSNTAGAHCPWLAAMASAAEEDRSLSLREGGRALMNRQAYAPPASSEYRHLSQHWLACCEGDVESIEQSVKKSVDFTALYRNRATFMMAAVRLLRDPPCSICLPRKQRSERMRNTASSTYDSVYATATYQYHCKSVRCRGETT
jgi:hypothetical protein